MANSREPQVICAEVVRRLQQVRDHKGWSKYEMAKRSGVSQSMLGRMERGLRNPTLETLLKLAAALDVDLGEIISAASRDAVRSAKR